MTFYTYIKEFNKDLTPFGDVARTLEKDRYFPEYSNDTQQINDYMVKNYHLNSYITQNYNRLMALYKEDLKDNKF
ncbi:hypothetical protein K0017_05005 [Staphylococcus massiliensis]|uniref:YozE family protein n=1 Tax=Staphylococcus massiliensis TaxID=555791 RepID=UPI001EE0EA12|nr:YozE family protein [Staphylococcus massiliensis]MCG3401678.1 hypothetical protein [Staphylococcus massiliensis]